MSPSYVKFLHESLQPLHRSSVGPSLCLVHWCTRRHDGSPAHSTGEKGLRLWLSRNIRCGNAVACVENNTRAQLIP